MWVFATCTTNRTGAWVEKTSNRNGKARLFKTVKLTFFPAPSFLYPSPMLRSNVLQHSTLFLHSCHLHCALALTFHLLVLKY
jgi:hypothetical protein